MNNSDHNLGTDVSSKTLTNSKMFSATSEENKNKVDSEFFDNSMICDDWIDYDHNENKDNTSADKLSQESANKIPSIPDTRHSEIQLFAPPKSKKRKLQNFDELLENLNYNILFMNFTKLLQFLESNNTEMCFHFTLKQYEEFFKMVVRDISLLKSRSLDANYRDICDKIIEATSFEHTGYLLTYVYEYSKDFKNKVLVIKKFKLDESEENEEETPSYSYSMESYMQSTSTEEDNEILSRPPSATVSSGFIIHCLRTTAAFIKNDVTKIKEFPELSTEQTQFMHLLLESVVAFCNFDSNLEIKELYRSLWEAVKIYNLKYEFRIKLENCGEKKSLVFEKIPKLKLAETTANSIQTAVNSNQIINSQIEVSKPEVSKTQISKPVAPKPELPKQQISKPELSKTQISKPELPKPQISKPELPKPQISKPKLSKTQISKPELSKTQISKPEISKPELSKTQISKTESPKTQISKPQAPNPEFLKPVVTTPTQALTKKMLKKQLKSEKELLFIKNLPSAFVFDTLNLIIDFLTDDQRAKMILVPNNQHELDFYRKCIDWCRNNYIVSRFSGQHEKLHNEIKELLTRVKCKVPKGKANKINERTGFKEVTYIKKLKYVKPVEDPHFAQSLRNKKKNKKLRNAKLKANNNVPIVGSVSDEIYRKAMRQGRACYDDSSSETCSERGTSCDRRKVAAKAQQVAKRASKEISQNTKEHSSLAYWERLRTRRGAEMHRKDLLLEALSVPVQSDKAMKIMRGMGWSGGALGMRGIGITEPLMPPLDLPSGAGFGHSKSSKPEPIPKKPKLAKTVLNWYSKNSNAQTETDETDNDVIVEKTKQLLLGKPSFDTLIKATEPSKQKTTNVDLPKQITSNFKLPKPITSNVELTKPTTSNVELSKPTTSNVELTKPTTSNVELTKPKTSNVELTKPTTSNVELTKPTTSNVELTKPTTSNVEHPKPTKSALSKQSKRCIEPSFRQEILYSVLELLERDATSKILKYDRVLPKKNRTFAKTVMEVLRGRGKITMILPEEREIYYKIREMYRKQPQVVVKAFISSERFTTIELRKLPTEIKNLTIQQHFEESIVSPKPLTDIITENNIKSYIESSGTPYESKKSYDVIKFRVLVLLNILNFVKSFNEELELTFNKILPQKQQVFIEKAVDEINLRIKFGGTPAETNLSLEIKNHVKDAFLGVMFNHQYTSVTLNKYFRAKRLNRPDNVTKRKSQTSVNLDNFTSESTSGSKLYSDVTTSKENINIDKNNASNESNGSIEEYNINTIDKIPNLPPGKDYVNLSKSISFYDKEKINTTDIKNNNNKEYNIPKNNKIYASRFNSNETENRHNKNNIGNGNVVIGNNDNQMIDVKKDDGNTKNTKIKQEMNIDETEMAEYIVCVDCTEEVITSGEMTVDIKIEENSSDSELVVENNDQPMKHVDVVVTNEDNFEKMDQHEKNYDNIDDNIDKMVDEVLLNIENVLDIDVMINDNPDNNDDYTENIIEEIKNISENPYMDDFLIEEETNVIMKEADVNEPIEVISVKEESITETNKNISLKEIGVERMEENSINPNDEQIVKEKTNLEFKTDCDIIPKEIDLSANNCNTHIVGSSHLKTVGTETDVPNYLNKKDTEIKMVYIVHNDHPIRKLNKKNAMEIQKLISSNIVETNQLPLLVCCGVQNGALIYTCHNEKSYDWLQNIISVASNVRVLNIKDVTKMALKFNCFFHFDSDYLFKMIKLYNQELSTKKWVVEKMERHGDYAIFFVRMDKFSINFIHASNLALFAGVDMVECSLIWE